MKKPERKPITIVFTAAEFELVTMAAGGQQHAAEYIRTAALLAAKEVQQEGV